MNQNISCLLKMYRVKNKTQDTEDLQTSLENASNQWNLKSKGCSTSNSHYNPSYLVGLRAGRWRFQASLCKKVCETPSQLKSWTQWYTPVILVTVEA
jgi:hypothetical protein